MEIKARETAIFSTNVLEEQKNIKLKNTLHVPNLRTNLISVSKITDNNYNVIFRKEQATVIDRNGIMDKNDLKDAADYTTSVRESTLI